MQSLEIALTTWAFVFGGALLGMGMKRIVPKQHLDEGSKQTVTLAMGLVATTAALVLGLLIASGKAYFDSQNDEMITVSTRIVMLDRLLGQYGPETQPARAKLREQVQGTYDRLFSPNVIHSEPTLDSASAETVFDRIEQLQPHDMLHRALQSDASSIALSISETRLLMHEQSTARVSPVLLVVLIFWLTLLFASFGLYAPTNATVVVCLFLSALSVAGAILLILEMYTPYNGLFTLSNGPLRDALAHLGS